MRKAYHYIPLRYYKEIERGDKILNPKTAIVPKPVKVVFRLDIPKQDYLFCLLDSPEPKSWVKSGWLKKLKERQGSSYAILSFDLKENDPADVLNATDLYSLMDKLEFFSKPSIIDPIKIPAKMVLNYTKIRNAYKGYINSKVLLKDYKDNFVIPELIVAKAIPFSELSLEQIVEKNHPKIVG